MNLLLFNIWKGFQRRCEMVIQLEDGNNARAISFFLLGEGTKERIFPGLRLTSILSANAINFMKGG